MCAHAVRVAIERLDGVESVEMSLNEGRATIRLADENGVALSAIRRTVEQGGFTPREAVVEVAARVLVQDGRLRLRVPGADEIYDLPSPGESAFERDIGKAVLIEGRIPVPKQGETPRIEDVKPARNRDTMSQRPRNPADRVESRDQ